MTTVKNKKANTTKPSTPNDSDINWIECSCCSRWDLYENYNIAQPYSPSKMSKLHIICRLCSLEQALQKATDEITVLKELLHALESSHLTDVKTCTDLVKELESCKPLTSVHPSTTTDPSSILRYTADEVFEITKRKLNIIILDSRRLTTMWKIFWFSLTLTITYRHLLLLMTLNMQNDWVAPALRKGRDFSVSKSIRLTLVDSCWKCGNTQRS